MSSRKEKNTYGGEDSWEASMLDGTDSSSLVQEYSLFCPREESKLPNVKVFLKASGTWRWLGKITDCPAEICSLWSLVSTSEVSCSKEESSVVGIECRLASETIPAASDNISAPYQFRNTVNYKSQYILSWGSWNSAAIGTYTHNQQSDTFWRTFK